MHESYKTCQAHISPLQKKKKKKSIGKKEDILIKEDKVYFYLIKCTP